MDVETEVLSCIYRNAPSPIVLQDDYLGVDLVMDLGFDSVSLFSLLCELEEVFGVFIMCTSLPTFTIQEVISLVENKITIGEVSAQLKHEVTNTPLSR